MVFRAEGKTAQAGEMFAAVRAIKNERMTPVSSDMAADQEDKR
jgi:hypothetical protein